MSKFTNNIKIEFSDCENYRFKLLEPLIWQMDEIGGKEIIIPTGFKSDGVTIPRAFWWFIPPIGHPATKAAILHDYLLKIYRPDRHIADKQFYLALKATRVNKLLCLWLYMSVRFASLFK